MTDEVIVTPAILSFLAAAHSAAPGAPLEKRKERGQEARRFLLTPKPCSPPVPITRGPRSLDLDLSWDSSTCPKWGDWLQRSPLLPLGPHRVLPPGGSSSLCPGFPHSHRPPATRWQEPGPSARAG